MRLAAKPYLRPCVLRGWGLKRDNRCYHVLEGYKRGWSRFSRHVKCSGSWYQGASAAWLPRATPNPYEVPSCQETHLPSERMLPIFFRGAAGEARPSLATCCVCIAVCWGPNV